MNILAIRECFSRYVARRTQGVPTTLFGKPLATVLMRAQRNFSEKTVARCSEREPCLIRGCLFLVSETEPHDILDDHVPLVTQKNGTPGIIGIKPCLTIDNNPKKRFIEDSSRTCCLIAGSSRRPSRSRVDGNRSWHRMRTDTHFPMDSRKSTAVQFTAD